MRNYISYSLIVMSFALMVVGCIENKPTETVKPDYLKLWIDCIGKERRMRHEHINLMLEGIENSLNNQRVPVADRTRSDSFNT